MMRKPHTRAFTIVELIVILVIVGILAAVAAVSYNTYVQRSHQAVTNAAGETVGRLLAADSVRLRTPVNDYTEENFATIMPDLQEAVDNMDAYHLAVYPANTEQYSLINWASPRTIDAGTAQVCNEDYTYCAVADLNSLDDWSGEEGTDSGGGSGSPVEDGIVFITDPDNPATVPGSEVIDNPDGSQEIVITPGEGSAIPATWVGPGVQPECEILDLPAGYTYDPVTCTIQPADTPAFAAQSVSSGSTHTCALSEQGTVVCFGDNSRGALGSGISDPLCLDSAGCPTGSGITPQGATLPVSVLTADGSALSSVNSTVSGFHYSCAVRNDSSLWCWGDSPLGSSPFATQRVASGVAAVTAGENQLWIVTSNGQVQQSSGGTLTNVTLPAALSGSANQIAYGSGRICVAAPGADIHCAPVTNYSFYSMGGATGLGEDLTGGSDGGAICWKRTANEIRCTAQHSDGLSGSGRTTNPTLTRAITAASPVTDLGLSGAATCYTMQSGSAQCLGPGRYGQRGTGPSNGIGDVAGGNFFTSISAGALATDSSHDFDYGHVCGVTADKHVKCWGGYYFGEIGDGTVPGNISPLGNTYPEYRSNPATVPVPVTTLEDLPQTIVVTWLNAEGVKVSKNVTIKQRPGTVGDVPGFPSSTAVLNVSRDPAYFNRFNVRIPTTFQGREVTSGYVYVYDSPTSTTPLVSPLAIPTEDEIVTLANDPSLQDTPFYFSWIPSWMIGSPPLEPRVEVRTGTLPTTPNAPVVIRSSTEYSWLYNLLTAGTRETQGTVFDVEVQGSQTTLTGVDITYKVTATHPTVDLSSNIRNVDSCTVTVPADNPVGSCQIKIYTAGLGGESFSFTATAQASTSNIVSEPSAASIANAWPIAPALASPVVEQVTREYRSFEHRTSFIDVIIPTLPVDATDWELQYGLMEGGEIVPKGSRSGGVSQRPYIRVSTTTAPEGTTLYLRVRSLNPVSGAGQWSGWTPSVQAVYP